MTSQLGWFRPPPGYPVVEGRSRAVKLADRAVDRIRKPDIAGRLFIGLGRTVSIVELVFADRTVRSRPWTKRTR